MAMTPPRLDLTRIEQARSLIDPIFLRTPQYELEALGASLGVRLLVKIETLNPIRSFKGRGAELFFARDAGSEPLVCASAGNFGAAMAYAARSRALPITIFASERANPRKVATMRALGATVLEAGHDFDAAKVAARSYAREHGYRFVEDGREIAISEGAGTIALEAIEAEPAIDAIFVPLGNGALLAGVATVLRARAPSVTIVAVAAEGAPAMTQSLVQGRIVTTDRVDTIADGIAVREPVPEALTDLHGLWDQTILVSDTAILTAIDALHDHAGIVVEPAGAVGVAALQSGPGEWRGARVLTIVCGSNLDPSLRHPARAEPRGG
jgi:threonine dehydratase